MRPLLTTRALLLGGGTALATYAVGTVTAGLRHPTTGSFEALLVALAAWVLLAASLWGALIGAAALVEALTAGRVRAMSWVATPPAVRRALMAALGLALAGGLPGPVSADVRRHTVPATHRPADLALPVPDRLPVAPTAAPRTSVLVRPGDTLWALARSRLPTGAEDARVAAAVRHWHARNRAAIGPDPDLIHPGQRLVVPGRTQR